MTYTVALQAPNRQQWEASSAYSQSWNCGPTCVAFVAGFYTDSHPAIEYSRRMIGGMGPYYGIGASPSSPVYGSPARTPTNAQQQRDMLGKRGVPATVRTINSVAELHGLVDSGRRPVIVGIEMSRVPAGIRGHSFTGWHAVVVISGAFQNGARGFWINDPNFAAGSPYSRRFYSDSLMQIAWANNTPRNCVVPNAAKPTATLTKRYCKFNDGVNGVNIRTSPAIGNNVYAIAYADPRGIRGAETDRRIGSTSSRRELKATRSVGGVTWYQVNLGGGTWVQAQFMHRVF